MRDLGTTEGLLIAWVLAILVGTILLAASLAGRRSASGHAGPLRRCPDCSGIVSVHASMCPHCGSPADVVHEAGAPAATPAGRVRSLGRIVLWVSGFTYTGALVLTLVAIATNDIEPNVGPLFEAGILGTAVGFLLLYLAPQPGDGPGRWRTGRRCLKVALLFAMVGVWWTLATMTPALLILAVAAAIGIVGVTLTATAATSAAVASEA